MTLIAVEHKTAILEDAKTRILQGDTLEQIAASHGISKRTLNTWLISLGDDYAELRQVWIDNLIAEAKEGIDNANDNFPLARAREQWKAVTWLAERRDRLRYGQQPMNINIIQGISMEESLAGEAITLLDSVTKDS